MKFKMAAVRHFGFGLALQAWYRYVPTIDLNMPAKFGKCILNGSKVIEY